MASNRKKPLHSTLSITLFFLIGFTILALIILYNISAHCKSDESSRNAWSGDLRNADFNWNLLRFDDDIAPPVSLKIAVFSRKWPTTSTPGGMERHAHRLHTALGRRGHRIHIFTSPVDLTDPLTKQTISDSSTKKSPVLHWHDGEPDIWRPERAWEQFQEENQADPFDVVHSESVALPYWFAKKVPNLAVSWHGIALEGAQSSIYQELIRKPNEPIDREFNESLQGVIPKVIEEIRFFRYYAQHVATSDSCGEILRDVYQIPTKRVHVIVNGVNKDEFIHDLRLGHEFRLRIGIPQNASIVFGVSGRLVKDKGHPLLHETFSKLKLKHPNVYLIVAGSGPWMDRYKELGPQVIVLGSMNTKELRSFYNAIDIFLNPTLRPGGLDQTQLEAMMSGTPVMASRLPPFKMTIMVNDEFGFMFAPNVESLYEALEEVVAEGSVRLAQRGKACKNYADSVFTARKMASAYEKLFLCMHDPKFCFYP